MGTVSTPGAPKPPAPPPPEGEGEPLSPEAASLATQTTRRIRIPEKKMPLGPKLSTIFGSIAAVAVVAWFIFRPPQRLPVVTLAKYITFEANLEQGSPLDCRARGCLLVMMGTDPKSQGAIPSVVEMAQTLEEQGVETTFVVTGDVLKECARVARAFRRPVLLDPDGQLQKALEIERTPFWVVYEPTGKIRHRTHEPMTDGQVLREAGL
ncbi:MAG TPA: hypothetical protein VL084_16030 [Thermoanaerobaculia bacterium]|nr:hypothetical protein [Thermoanaerobaculia bacterium]